MAMISGQVVVALGASLPNALAGDIFEFLRADSTVKFGVVASALGADFTFKIGDAIVVENAPIGVEIAVGQVSADRDMKYVDAGRAGERLTLTLNNPTGGNITITWLLLIA